MKQINIPYDDLNTPETLPDSFMLTDTLNGFDSTGHNEVFQKLNIWARKNNRQFTIWWHQLVPTQSRSYYSNINIKFSAEFQQKMNFQKHVNYLIHPDISYKNFICTFNGTPHTSRKLLVSILHRFGWFDPKYSSKNFTYDLDNIHGYIRDYVGEREVFYNKFFVGPGSDKFAKSIYSFGHHRYDHAQNIYNLENQLTQSFIHIVSESLSTSHVPYITEKFLYSIVTRGLFLNYAQPLWHKCLEECYGFLPYNKLFDYRFDTIENPVERVVELTNMLAKFSHLTPDDWRDLYLLEQDTIEYNYNHYFSGNYLEHLRRYEY